MRGLPPALPRLLARRRRPSRHASQRLAAASWRRGCRVRWCLKFPDHRSSGERTHGDRRATLQGSVRARARRLPRCAWPPPIEATGPSTHDSGLVAGRTRDHDPCNRALCTTVDENTEQRFENAEQHAGPHAFPKYFRHGAPASSSRCAGPRTPVRAIASRGESRGARPCATDQQLVGIGQGGCALPRGKEGVCDMSGEVCGSRETRGCMERRWRKRRRKRRARRVWCGAV